MLTLGLFRPCPGFFIVKAPGFLIVKDNRFKLHYLGQSYSSRYVGQSLTIASCSDQSTDTGFLGFLIRGLLKFQDPGLERLIKVESHFYFKTIFGGLLETLGGLTALKEYELM